ncbi:MAG: hypothetical protein QGI45_11705, partial [Myxococcota bacterium]|nr:hypothetical protein [Myxococcota bacterium]
MKTSAAPFLSLLLLSACGTDIYDLEYDPSHRQDEMRYDKHTKPDTNKKSSKHDQRSSRPTTKFSGNDGKRQNQLGNENASTIDNGQDSTED